MGTTERASDAAEVTPAVPVVAYRSAGANAREGARPAGLTALGVTSVVIGVLGLGLHLATVPTTARTFQQTAAPVPPAVLPAQAPDANGIPMYTPPYTGEWRPLGSMGRAERELVVEHLTARLALGVDRRLMLRRLLADTGGEIFGRAEPDRLRDQAAVAARIDEVGQTPVGPDGTGAFGTQYFRTRGGTVLLDDNVARFFPADRSPPVRAEQDLVTRGRADAEPHLGTVLIERDLDALRRKHGAAFTPVQATALGRWLTLLTPRDPAFAVFSAEPAAFDGWDRTRVIGGGTVEIDPGYLVWFLRDGRVIVNPAGLDPSTGLPFPPAPSPRAMTRSIAYAGAAHLIVGVALASFLAVCGTMTLADAPAAARNHARWAWVKLASVVVFTIPIFAAAVAGARDRYGYDARGQIATAVVAAAVILIAQVAYPIIVLSTLRSPRVEAFYFARGASIMPVSAARRDQWRRWAEVCSGGRRGVVIAALAGVVIAAALLIHAALARRPAVAEAWYAWTATRVTVVLVAAAALTACAVRITRRGVSVVATILVLCLTMAATAPATRPRRSPPQPRIFQSPAVFGRVVEEAVVRDSRSSEAYLRQTADEAARAPALEPLRARPLPDDFRDRVAEALDELGWVGCAEALHSLLTDPDASVRRAAALAIHDDPRLAARGPHGAARVNAALAGELPEETQRRLLATDQARSVGVDWSTPATAPSAAALLMVARDVTPAPPPAWLAPVATAVSLTTSFAVLLVAAAARRPRQ